MTNTEKVDNLDWDHKDRNFKIHLEHVQEMAEDVQEMADKYPWLLDIADKYPWLPEFPWPEYSETPSQIPASQVPQVNEVPLLEAEIKRLAKVELELRDEISKLRSHNKILEEAQVRKDRIIQENYATIQAAHTRAIERNQIWEKLEKSEVPLHEHLKDAIQDLQMPDRTERLQAQISMAEIKSEIIISLIQCGTTAAAFSSAIYMIFG